MFAMLCRRPGVPLEWAEVPDPRPEPHQLLIRVRACGVCRTDLHVVDGDLLERGFLAVAHQGDQSLIALGAEDRPRERLQSRLSRHSPLRHYR